ncbi:MAG: glycerate kinase [Bacillota bacterium]|nr:glycerate kinase [Bacillota bacterium]
MKLTRAPKIILALDSFKGSLSSLEAATAVESGIKRALPKANIIKIPVADGGEGTAETLVLADSGTMHKIVCHDPLLRKMECYFGLSKDKQTAFIEVAQSTGLTLVEPHLRDPLSSTTYGVGEQIKAALELGARNFIVCLGGSSTVDGGAGLLQALGVRFYSGEFEIEATPKALDSLTRIDTTGLDPRIKEATFRAACDVDNPLCGKNGAAYVFGPQKGASAHDVKFLDQLLLKLGLLYEEATQTPILTEPKMGAAGGIPAALKAFLGAQLEPGVNLVLDFLNFDSRIADADLIITGEGSLDCQSLGGKTPLGVLKAGKKAGIPVIALAGKVELNASTFLDAGFKAVFSIAPGPISLEESVQRASELLSFTAENVINLVF